MGVNDAGGRIGAIWRCGADQPDQSRSRHQRRDATSTMTMEIQTEGITTARTRRPNGQLGSAAAKTAPTGRNTAPCRRT